MLMTNLAHTVHAEGALERTVRVLRAAPDYKEVPCLKDMCHLLATTTEALLYISLHLYLGQMQGQMLHSTK